MSENEPEVSVKHAQPRPHRYWAIAAAVLLLWVMFAQLVGGAIHDAVTADEDTHLAHGYAFWRAHLDGDRVVPHPPISSVLATWPLLPLRDLYPFYDVSWLPPYLLPIRAYHPLYRIVFAGRVPMILLSVLMAAVAFRWAASWYGYLGGLLTLMVCVLDPNVLAHGRLVGTDAGLLALGFIAAYIVTRLWSRPTVFNLILAAFALEAALRAKRTAIYLIPPLAVTFVASVLQASPVTFLPTWLRKRVTGWRGIAMWSLVLLIALGLLTTLTGRLLYWDWSVQSESLSAPTAAYSQAASLTGGKRESGHPAFFMGQYSPQVWPAYFPTAFAIKTPLPTLLLLGLALFSCVLLRPRWYELALLLFPITLLAAVMLFSPLNIGYRHILPVLPFLFVFIGRLALVLERRYLKVVVLVLIAWLLVWSICIYPHHLAFFNELIGGPGNGYKYLVDSNLDWGQANKELATYLHQRGIERVWPALFTAIDPAAYGICYDPLPTPWAGDWIPDFPRFNPPPGVYVIGATNLQGVYFSPADRDVFDWFRRHEPVDRIGYSIFVYEVTARLTDHYEWVAVCGTPEPPLQNDEIGRRFGRDDLRIVYFNCEHSWVYPALGTSGWYILPLQGDRLPALSGDYLLDAPIVYAAPNAPSPYAVVAWEGDRSPPSLLDALCVREDRVLFGDSLRFVGHRVVEPEGGLVPGSQLQAIAVDTVWVVESGPVEALISIFAHLLTPEGTLITTGDGLGVPAVQWLPGDWIVQRHSMAAPPQMDVARSHLRVGVYDLVTGVRWIGRKEGEAVEDGLLIDSWQVIRGEE